MNRSARSLPRLALASVASILAIAAGSCGNRVARGGSGDDGGFVFNGADGGSDQGAQGCTGLSCYQMDCGELSSPTTLTGTVYAPNGTLPLYNAIVYVPNTAVDAFPTTGLTCDRCDGHVSGDPLVQAVTGPDGKFQLVNVPAGTDIPLVIQLGKWRRQVMIPNVPACTTTALPAAETRLPKNKSEGDIPRMAISTGSADPMECLLLKVGLDPNEIKEPGHGARVEFYQSGNAPGTTISASTPQANDPNKGLYTNYSHLSNYDIVLLPCEGEEVDQGAMNTANVAKYVNEGGRVFATHYSYDWLTYSASPFNQVAQPQTNGLWPKDQQDYPFDDSQTTVTKLVTNFPKGKAFAAWLKAAGATSAQNTLGVQAIRHDIDGVNAKYAQAWATDTITGNGTTNPGVAELTFNTPLDAPLSDGGVPEYCGRVVYSDFHVSSQEADQSKPFPGACMMSALTDQEKALAFMLFDLSSCVQSDAEPPIQ